MLAKESLPSSFDLPNEVLEVLPSDPFQQLDVARKITSLALSTRVSALESESSDLRQQLTERDAFIADLHSQLDSLDSSLSQNLQKLSLADQEKVSFVYWECKIHFVICRLREGNFWVFSFFSLRSLVRYVRKICWERMRRCWKLLISSSVMLLRYIRNLNSLLNSCVSNSLFDLYMNWSDITNRLASDLFGSILTSWNLHGFVKLYLLSTVYADSCYFWIEKWES